MTNKLLHEDSLVAQALLPDAYSAGTNNGPGVDTTGYDFAELELNVGTITATGTLDAKVQTSSDDAATDAYADLASAVFAQKTPASDETVYVMVIDLRKLTERWLRCVAVTAVAAVNVGAVWRLYKGDNHRPISQTNAVVSVL